MLVTELYAQLGFQFDKAAFSQAQAALSGIHFGLAKIAAVAVGAAVGFGAMVTSMVNQGKEIENTSQALGLSTDQLQDWRNAARFAGVEANAFVVGIRHLSNMVHEARLGNAQAAYSLMLIGAHGKDANAAMMAMADTVSKMPDGMEKTARVNMVFGARMGSKLIPILNLGRKGIQEYMDAARDLGATLSRDTIRKADEAYLSQARLKMAFEGLRNTLIGPFLTSVNKWRDALTQWIKLHRQVIASGFKEFMDKLGKTLKGTSGFLNLAVEATRLLWHNIELLVDVTVKVVGWLDQLTYRIAGVKAGAALLAVVLTGIFSPKSLGIAALMVALDDFYVYAQGGDSVIGNMILPAFHHFWHSITKWIHEATDEVNNFWDSITDGAAHLLSEFPGGVSLLTSMNDARIQQQKDADDPRTYNARIMGAVGAIQQPSSSVNVAGGVTIQISGAGDPQAVGTATVQAFADYCDSQVQSCAAQLGTPPTRNN
jgi:hypothetical protein